ncbi:MAG: exonuclease domain-containing protein [Saprospiraceae bacterium]|nr:exonuclease domain-containing protein [Saprospiraceae bacterium]MBK9632563.1 exonuclease domain-containing protein [Saprospiraceae bacterium]
MNLLVFDLEATCWNSNGTALRKQEIIEIGACILDEYGRVESTFQSFVKPQMNPFLSNYCMQLTTITQEEIDKAKSFPKVLESFIDWANPEDEDYIFCAWGDADKDLLKSDAQSFNLDISWLKPYIDIKARYHRNRQLSKLQGLDRVMHTNGFHFEGQRHRAIYDALNLAKLVAKYKEEWV